MLSSEIVEGVAPKGAAASPKRHLRPITEADLPQVERLFFDVFRNGKGDRTGFADYFRRLFLDGPHAGGGLASDGEGDTIAAVIAFVPMRYKIYDETVTAKLSCAFMADTRFPKAAARVVMSLRARSQDLLFTDSGSHAGVGHWLAGGGAGLPVQSLDWRCRFLPVTAAAQKLRLPGILDGAAKAIDRLAARLRPRPQPTASLSSHEITAQDFADLVPTMLEQFPVRPDWSREELLWLLGFAAENRTLGELRFFAFSDASGKPAGCLAGYFDRRGRVRVLDLLTLPGKEAGVVASALAFLQARGTVEASGVAQPHLLFSLSPHRGVSYRHRSFSCVATRFDAVKTAITHNEIYMGGLAGEGWSRLMTDFY